MEDHEALSPWHSRERIDSLAARARITGTAQTSGNEFASAAGHYAFHGRATGSDSAPRGSDPRST